MQFAVYSPPQAAAGRVPVLYYLAGLTCTEETFVTKAGALEHAARHGLMLVAPDTSPRVRCPAIGSPGISASPPGFYLDATQAPWSKHYHMYSYVVDELPGVIAANFPADTSAQRHHGPFDGRPRRADHRAQESAEVPLVVGVRADRRADPGALGTEGVHGLPGCVSRGVVAVRRHRAGEGRSAIRRRHPRRPGHGGQIPATTS